MGDSHGLLFGAVCGKAWGSLVLPIYSLGPPLTTGTRCFQWFSLFPWQPYTLWSLTELGKESPVLFQGGLKATRGQSLCFSLSPRSSWPLPVTKEVFPYSLTDTAMFTPVSLGGPGRNGLTALPRQQEAFGSSERGTLGGCWSLVTLATTRRPVQSWQVMQTPCLSGATCPR